MQHSSGATIRPYIRAGVTFLSEDSVGVTTSFLGAAFTVDPFRVTTNFDSTFADLEAGLNFIGTDGLNLKLEYQGRFGEETQINSGGVKFGVRF